MHDPLGSSKLRQWHFSAWVKRRGHRDDLTVPAGEVREPDEWLELSGDCPPVRVTAFLEGALLSGRRVYGVLIAVREEDG